MFVIFFFAIYDACHLLSVCQVKTKKKKVTKFGEEKLTKKNLKKKKIDIQISTFKKKFFFVKLELLYF